MKKIINIFLVMAMLSACVPSEDENLLEETKEIYYEEEALSVELESEENVQIYENLPDPVMINADFEVTTNPEGTFLIKTNLPDETELSLKLSGRGYLAQGKAFVSEGEAISERFTNQGEQLVGDYSLEVLMPIPNVQTDYVKHFIGKNGEYLTGPYIKGALGTVVVSKEFKVSFSKVSGIGQKEVQPAYVDTSDTDVVYYRTPTGNRYHLDMNCGGKNSYKTTNISGLTPCSKCTK